MATKKKEMVNDTRSDKQKALDTALAQLTRDFGDGAVMKLGENKKMNVQAVSTGSISLDMALGIGGVPRHRRYRYGSNPALPWWCGNGSSEHSQPLHAHTG